MEKTARKLSLVIYLNDNTAYFEVLGLVLKTTGLPDKRLLKLYRSALPAPPSLDIEKKLEMKIKDKHIAIVLKFEIIKILRNV